MKPPADAPAVDEAVDPELDTYLDTDAGPPAAALLPEAGGEVPSGSARVPVQAARAAPVVPVQPATPAPPVRAAVEAAPAEAAPAEPAPAEPAPPGLQPAGPALTDRERQILAFEHRWWRHAGAKEQAIHDAFGISATRYYQLLNKLLDNPAALAAEPMLVGRLRRLRSAQARTRRR